MSYDARDSNRDGKVSIVEKVKDKLHLGHKDKDTYTTTHHATSSAYTAPTSIAGAQDLNHDGHISTSEKLASGTHPYTAATGSAMPLASGSGFADSRDLNRDGHISTSEKLASAASHRSGSGFTDSRDLNRDGHVSTTEKLATAGSNRSGFTDSRDLNRDGHISTAEKLASGSHMSSGFADSRDLNRDGHVSTAEKLATAGSNRSGFTDSRDLNRDGHISTAEKLASGSHMAGAHMTEEARLRLHEEQLAISKREVGAGEVDIHKRVQQEVVQQTIPVRREEVTVERHALHGAAEPGARIATQDEVVRVPLFREEVITEKRIVPTEEVVVRKQEFVDQQTVGATLRSEYVETTQAGISAGLAGVSLDARDTNRDGHVSMGEKLKSGINGNAYNNGAFDARDTNRDGHVSMGEKFMGNNKTGLTDSRDLNRDGHVSMGEKMKTADMNGDGRVSMGEKIKAARG
jgi:uncharacterized protein (TIGR02271 family)